MDSAFYWLQGGFHDAGRISHNPYASTANSSVDGLLTRLHAPGALATAVAVILAAVAVKLAAVVHRRGHAVLAIALVGMACAAASPFSWSHHWVWFAPLLVHLGYRAYVRGRRGPAWTLWLLCTLLGGWFTSLGDHREAGVLSLRPGGVWNDVMPGTYVLVFVGVLIGTVVWLRRSAVQQIPDAPVTAVPVGARTPAAG